MSFSPLAPIDRLRALPREERVAFYRGLPPGALAAAGTDPRVWARLAQALPAPGDLRPIELVTGGRRAGKTQWADWMVLREWLTGRAKRVRIIGSTAASVRKQLIRGPSGLWTWLPYEYKARVGHNVDNAWTRGVEHAGTFEIPGLPPIDCLSAEKPGSAVGDGYELTWADDPAAWIQVCGYAKAAAMFREARISTSEGPRPCLVVSTTTQGVQFLRRALKDPDNPDGMRGVRRRHLGSAHENTALSAAYKGEVLGDLEGEGDDSDITGEEHTEAKGALWKRGWIDPYRVDRLPELVRVVVAIDPADDGKASSDETGIVVVGLGDDGRLYVLGDMTGLWTADRWAALAAWAARRWEAVAFVLEGNRSYSANSHCLHIEAPNVHVERVDAGEGKRQRAEPVSLYYRDGLVSHLRSGLQLHEAGGDVLDIPIFNPATGQRDPKRLDVRRARNRWGTLEDELCGWEPAVTPRSPNGLDALVWGCRFLRPPVASTPWVPLPPSPSRFGAADPRAPIPPRADPRRPAQGLLARRRAT